MPASKTLIPALEMALKHKKEAEATAKLDNASNADISEMGTKKLNKEATVTPASTTDKPSTILALDLASQYRWPVVDNTDALTSKAPPKDQK